MVSSGFAVVGSGHSRSWLLVSCAFVCVSLGFRFFFFRLLHRSLSFQLLDCFFFPRMFSISSFFTLFFHSILVHDMYGSYTHTRSILPPHSPTFSILIFQLHSLTAFLVSVLANTIDFVFFPWALGGATTTYHFIYRLYLAHFITPKRYQNNILWLLIPLHYQSLLSHCCHCLPTPLMCGARSLDTFTSSFPHLLLISALDGAASSSSLSIPSFSFFLRF